MSINPVDPDTEPLLQQHGDGLYLERSSRSSLCSLRNTTDQPSPLVTKDAIQWRNLASLAFIILFYIFSNYLLVIPTLRLYERGVCREYYHERDGNSVADPDEELCKLPSIQARLATLLGWQMGLGAIPGLLTAVWFGSLADRYGRKSILLLAMVGEFVSWVWILLVCYSFRVFPIQAIWASNLFLFIGGGPRVTVSILSASLTDSVPERRRTLFLYLRASMSHIASLSAPLLAARLMERSLRLLFGIVFVLWIMTFISMTFFKETLADDTRVIQQFKSILGRWQTHDANERLSHQSVESTPKRQHKRIVEFIREAACSARDYIRVTYSGFVTPNLLICFSIFFFKRLAFTSETFVFQYASNILHWKLGKTAWIQFTHSLAALIVTGLLLPSLNTILQKGQRLRATLIDLSVTRGSILVAIIGCLWIWCARSAVAMVLGVFVLGLAEGLEPTVQGLAVSFVDNSITARLFTTIAVVDQVSTLISGPVMGGIYSASQGLDSVWQGLIYVIAAVIFTFLFVCTLFLRNVPR